MANIIHSLSKPMFDFVLTKSSDTFKKFYHYSEAKSYQNGHLDGSDWALVFMLSISLAAVLFYFFVVARKVKNISGANYLTVFLLGIVVLLLFNIFVIPNCVTPKFPLDEIWDFNLLKFCLMDVIYYIVFFVLWSFAVRKYSNDPNRHLLSEIKI